MQAGGAESAFLARSKSGGTERRAPPPVRPKPSTLASVPTESIPASSAAQQQQQRTPFTVTDDGMPASTAFGDLKRTFERQQNSSPLFMGGVGSTLGGSSGTMYSGARSGAAGGHTSSSHLSHASISRVQQQNSHLEVPSLNRSNSNSNSNSSNSNSNSNNSASNRPRSVSSPAPPSRENGGRNVNVSSNADADAESTGEGIDNSQPDFGNLRARFQSQASLSSVSLPKPDTPRPKPKPPVNSPKPILPVSTAPPIRASRMSLDSINTSAASSRFNSPQPPSIPAPYAPGLSTPSSSTRLSPASGSWKQPPRPPPALKLGFMTKTPTPPRTPTRVETPESERNPFMGSDEDEPGSSSSQTSAGGTPIRPSLPQRTSSGIRQNPVFQQLNNSSHHIGINARSTTLASVPGRDSVLFGKVAPPAPQRTAPRPESPQGPPPRLPTRSSSSNLSSTSSLSLVEDSPEEKERKHRLDKRRRVVQELMETEISFSKDMLLLQEVYVTDMAESPLFTQADEKIIFMNLGEVIELTLDFIALLTPACGGGVDEPYNDSATFVGEAFLQMTSRIRRVYSEYCKRQEASAQHLLELDGRKELKPFFDACTEKCKGKTTTWDLASMLIKPVQRVLKYPLLINQIHALTPANHPDHDSLTTVQKEMVQVAEEINEIKKRKDIVEKIVGSKKKNDSDIVYVHGFNKKFARTTQQLRQAVGGVDVTVDILFEALLEKFNLQQRLAREFARYILAWLVSIKQFFDTQEAFALTLREIYSMVAIHRNNENQSTILVNEFYKSLSQFSKTIGRELEASLKKTVYKSIENFLKLFSGPLQVMKKREKKLLDYDNVRGMKERGDTIDKNMLDSADAYIAINEQLVDELPKFLGLTTQYFDLIVMEFSKVQMFFYAQVKGKILEFFVAHMDPDASRDVAGYLASMNIGEDYISAMTRDDGPLARLQRISLIRNVAATHEMAFQEIRQTTQRRRRSASVSLPLSLSRRSSSASPSPMHTPTYEKQPWHSKSSSQGSSSIQSSFQLQSRYYPGEDENPFEIPESIFHDGSVASFDDYEPFGGTGSGGGGHSSRNSGMFGGSRPMSVASSSFSFNSGGGGVNHTDYQEFANSKPPALDEGMDADEIGIAQALFECTAIYPYTSTEDRQLSFEAGESIVVFGLNEDGWYFGKKVGKSATGWFPASHCIQI
ncbi:hypothetical protein EDD11_005449 [Mortierella claussenii]|nr:hypothetical protein EDD11_005449 [Mortierella claussenii]